MVRRRHVIKGTLLVAIVLATAGAVFFVWTFIRVLNTSLEAEERLHATILVSDVVGDFVEISGFTGWPASWEELEGVPPREWSTYRWPRDLPRLRELVRIDFNTGLEQVAAAKAETFTAVEPAGVCYEVWRGHAAEPLLERIRKGLQGSSDSPPSLPLRDGPT